MDISLLKTFMEVNKTRNFARAADNLFVTSAAVSARIKLLESQLGVSLFLRHRGNMQLTSEGERLLPFAETLMNTWARTLQEVSLLPELEARIRIGATSSMWSLSLQKHLKTLIEVMPEVAVQAEGHSTELLSRMLMDRTMDLIIAHDPPSTTECKVEKIGSLDLVLASTVPNSSVKAAMGTGYIYVDWGTAFASFHAERFSGSSAPAPLLKVNLASMAYDLLQTRAGATFLPRTLVEETQWLHPVTAAPSIRRSMFACFRESNDRIDIIRQVIQHLLSLSL